MREVLNVDRILSSDNEQQTSGQRRRPNEGESSWSPREDGKPKSLMTIYEDDQRHELGSRSSLETESREKERTKSIGNHFTLKTENWKNQRKESGYESSDRLSNGSASLDCPVVGSVGTRDLRRVPEVPMLR